MKANADHVVPIHPDLKAALERRLGRRRSVPTTGYVLGERLDAITKSFKGALKRAEIPQTIRWHDLRHTFATWVSVKAPYAVLRQLLGHSPGTVTFHYTHVPFDQLRDVVDDLPRLTPRRKGAARSPDTATRAPTPHSRHTRSGGPVGRGLHVEFPLHWGTGGDLPGRRRCQ